MSSLTTLQSNGTSSKKPENKSPAPYKSSAQKLSPVANKPASQVKPANQGKQNKEKPEVKVNSEDKSKNQKKTPPAGKCPPKTQHASTKEKSSGDWKTPDKKKTDKKQVGRSSKPRTPQMDRKKMGKKVENKDEKKPLRKQIQYEKEELQKIRAHVLQAGMRCKDLQPCYNNADGVWDPFRWHNDVTIKDGTKNSTHGTASPMKKRDDEVKKPSGRGDISLKPQRLSFANGASGFSNKKSNNDEEESKFSAYKPPSRRFEDSDGDRFGNSRGRFGNNRYDNRNYKPQQPYQPPQRRNYNDKNESWRNNNNTFNKYNNNPRWNNFEEETPEWMNDDDEGEEDLACFEDDPLQMMEDVDLTAAMPMGDLGDRFEIKEHHLKKKEEVLKDDSFEDPAIVNSKKQQKPSGVQKTVESDIPEDPAIVSFNNKNTVRETGTPLDNLLKPPNQKQESNKLANQKQDGLAQGDFEAMLKKANNKDFGGLDSQMNQLKLTSESIWNKPNNNRIASPMATAGTSLATNHMATNKQQGLSKILGDKLLSDNYKLENNLASGSNVQQQRQQQMMRGMQQGTNKFDQIQLNNQLQQQSTSGLSNLLTKPKTGGYNSEKLEELKKVLGQSANQPKKPEPSIMQQPSSIGLPATSIQQQLSSLQVRTTPQVQQHAATQQHIHQQRAAWTQLILQQLGCKTQQQMLAMLSNPAQKLLIDQAVNKRLQQQQQSHQLQQQIQQQQVQQQRALRNQLLAQQQGQGVVSSQQQQQILAVLQQQQMKTPQQLLVQQQLMKQQQQYQQIVLQQRRQQIIQQQLAAQQAQNQFNSISHQGNHQQQNQQQLNNISAYLQQKGFNQNNQVPRY